MAELPKYICFRVAPNDLEVYIKCVEPEEVAEDLRPVVRGKWKHGVCQTCFFDWSEVAPLASVPNFCPNCGADMCPE